MEPEKNKASTSDKKTLHILKLVIIGLLCFAVAVFVFGIGVWVGQERAEFSFSWAENYHRDFGGPDQGFFGNFPDQGFINGHGIFGKVIKIDGNDLIINGQDNVEKTIVVSSQTTIRNNASLIKLSDIKLNDILTVIGSPDSQGEIDAKFIRIFPSPSPTSMNIHNVNMYSGVASANLEPNL